MRIGELAGATGVDSATIRYYESVGVLPEPERTPAGYRVYGSDDVDRLRFVSQARKLEIPLADIRQIVGLRDRGEMPCRVVREAVAREKAAIDERIRQLERLRTDLERLERRANKISDEWPAGPCVCHFLETAELGPKRRQTWT